MRYRIKTEREFTQDFGTYWRKEVEFHFPESMDYLLGKELSEYHSKIFSEEGRICGCNSIENISSDMIITIKE